MRRAALLAGLVLLLAAADNPVPPGELPALPARDFARTPAVEVVDVRAGNVIVVQLAGELRQLRLIGTFVPAAGTVDDNARAYLWNLLRGERVHIEYEADWPLRDREGRYWAYVYRAPDGLFCNLELIRLGLARISAPDPFEFKELFETYERHARRAEKGVWSPDPKAPASQPASAPASNSATAGRAQPEAEQRATGDSTLTVYATKNGTRYHTAECRHAKGGAATPISLAEAKARGLTPCSHCKPPQ